VTGSPSASALLALLDRAVDVIAVIDRNGQLLYVNSTVTDRLAWSRAELLGTRALDLIHPEDLEVAAPALAVELAGGPSDPVEVRVRNRSGQFLWFEVLANGWIDEPGVSGLVLNLRESTGRHELAVLTARRAALDGRQATARAPRGPRIRPTPQPSRCLRACARLRAQSPPPRPLPRSIPRRSC